MNKKTNLKIVKLKIANYFRETESGGWLKLEDGNKVFATAAATVESVSF